MDRLDELRNLYINNARGPGSVASSSDTTFISDGQESVVSEASTYRGPGSNTGPGSVMSGSSTYRGPGSNLGPGSVMSGTSSYRGASTNRGPGSAMSSVTSRGRGAGTVMSAATTNRGPEDTAFWPDIRQRLTSDAHLRNYTVTCPVCAVSMRAEATSTRNRAMILCCGHMMCEPCITRIAANQDGPRDNPNARSPQCPYCATPVGKYPYCAGSCEHPGMLGLPMPKDMQEMVKFPRTTPEGGARPGCCPKCRMMRVERYTNKLVRCILNEVKARGVWEPTADHRPPQGDYSDYIRIRELDNFLEVLKDTVHSREIYQKYTWLQPSCRDRWTDVWAEMIDTRRNAI
ncbi:hypothetical protein EsH8_IV_001334 [Colletotrichum jinshuiense]